MPDSEEKGLDIKKGKEGTAGPKGKNYLLLIAIDDYEHCPRLSNCVKDAEDFREVLFDQYLFQEEHTFALFNTEATRRNIFSQLRKMNTLVTPDDNLVIYFSGHGDTVGDVGYWIPVEAHPDSVDEFVSTYDLKSLLDDINSFHTFVIADACFSGSLFLSFKNSLAVGYETKRSRWGLAASHSRERALDGTPGENSPFAARLLKNLRDNRENLGVQKLAAAVIDEVEAVTQKKQTPVFKPLNVRGDDSGQFVFRLKRASEAEIWEQASKTGNKADFQRYVDTFPKGIHAEEAQHRITALEAEEAWKKAKEENSISSFNDFIDKYPKSEYRTEARNTIQKLEDEKDWEEAKNIDAVYRYHDYENRHPQGAYVNESRHRRKLKGKETGSVKPAPKETGQRQGESIEKEEPKRVQPLGDNPGMPALDLMRKYWKPGVLTIGMLFVIGWIIYNYGPSPKPKGPTTDSQMIADYEKAIQENTIPEYRSFEPQYPTSQFKDSIIIRRRNLEDSTKRYLNDAELLIRKDVPQEKSRRLLDSVRRWNINEPELNRLDSIFKVVYKISPIIYNPPNGVPKTNMVRVPGDTFTMGCTNGDRNCQFDESPPYTVTLSDFQISKTEVTQDLWQKVMKTNPSSFRNCPQCPVEQVSWYDALVFCNRLSEIQRLTPCYYLNEKLNKVYGKKSDGTWGLPNSGEIYWDRKANGYRLPTEAEWEYAARGKKYTYLYSGSTIADSVAWYSKKTTKPVRNYNPNAFGLYDMSGNVFEWCWDRKGDYPSSAQTNPVGPSTGSARVFRGGSWERESPVDMRVTDRWEVKPDYRNHALGFRLARPQ